MLEIIGERFKMNNENIYKLSNSWKLHKEDLKKKKYYIFDISEGKIIMLNKVSFEILENVDGKKTLQDIFDILYMDFDVDKSVLLSDILSLVEKCRKEGILEEVL